MSSLFSITARVRHTFLELDTHLPPYCPAPIQDGGKRTRPRRQESAGSAINSPGEQLSQPEMPTRWGHVSIHGGACMNLQEEELQSYNRVYVKSTELLHTAQAQALSHMALARNLAISEKPLMLSLCIWNTICTRLFMVAYF